MEFDFDKIRKQGDGEPMLVTFKNWLMAADGNTYSCAWGYCKIWPSKEIVGFDIRGGETNWVLQIGKGNKSMFVLGCQIRAFVLCDLTSEIKRNTSILKVSHGE